MRLAQKLPRIRKVINGGLCQEEMLNCLGLKDTTHLHKQVRGWRAGASAEGLRSYAEMASVKLEVLADDKLMLSEKLS